MIVSFRNLANLFVVVVIGKIYAVCGLGIVEKVQSGVRGINS